MANYSQSNIVRITASTREKGVLAALTVEAALFSLQVLIAPLLDSVSVALI